MHRQWTKLAALAPSARELQARADAMARARQIVTPSESLVPSADPLPEPVEDAHRDRSTLD